MLILKYRSQILRMNGLKAKSIFSPQNIVKVLIHHYHYTEKAKHIDLNFHVHNKNRFCLLFTLSKIAKIASEPTYLLSDRMLSSICNLMHKRFSH